MIFWYEYLRDWVLSCPSFDGQMYSAIPELVHFVGDLVQSVRDWL